MNLGLLKSLWKPCSRIEPGSGGLSAFKAPIKSGWEWSVRSLVLITMLAILILNQYHH